MTVGHTQTVGNRAGRLACLGLSLLALSGCVRASVAPQMALPVTAEGMREPLVPVFSLDRRGSREAYFLAGLPPEADLPRQVIRVVGTPGQFNQAIRNEVQPTITSIIPNVRGFIFEGARLNKPGLKFYMGASEMPVGKVGSEQVVVGLPASGQSSGIITVRDGANTLLRASADAKNVYVAGRAVVKIVAGAPRPAVEKALQAAGMLFYRYAGMDAVVAYYPPGLEFSQVQSRLLAQPILTRVTRDTIYRPQGVGEPTAPRLAEQWGLSAIQAAAGWAVTGGTPDTVVAVLDTGVAITHPDLAVNIFKNTGEKAGNNIDDDGNGLIDDVNGWNSFAQNGQVEDEQGHGTAVAGVIAAANNSVGILGLAYNARILPCKVANAEGLATTSTLIDGINYAVRNRATVINLSQASFIDDAPLKEAVAFATAYNVTVVCSVGNDGANIKQYPAAWANEQKILAVGSSNSSDARSTWSNWGNWVTVVAPGEAILTTVPGNTYKMVNGTSYAAAYTSAYAALIKSLKPSYTPAMVRDLIIRSAVDKGDPGYDPYYGHGRISLVGALGSLLSNLIGNVDWLASSEHFLGDFPVEMAGDKDSETFWSSARRDQDSPEWMLLDWGQLRQVNSVAMLSAPYYAELFPADFRIELSKDKQSWQAVATEKDFRIAESMWRRWDFPVTTARYMRLNVTRSRVNPDNGLYYDQIAEVALNGEENAIIRNSSSNYYGLQYTSKRLRDRDPNTMWISANRTKVQPEFVIVDLGVSQQIRSVDLLSPPPIISEAFPRALSFSVSNDKVNWTFVKAFDKLDARAGAWYRFPVPTATGRYLRIDVTDTNNATSTGSLFAGRFLTGFTAAIAEVDVNRTD